MWGRLFPTSYSGITSSICKGTTLNPALREVYEGSLFPRCPAAPYLPWGETPDLRSTENPLPGEGNVMVEAQETSSSEGEQ